MVNIQIDDITVDGGIGTHGVANDEGEIIIAQGPGIRLEMQSVIAKGSLLDREMQRVAHGKQWRGALGEVQGHVAASELYRFIALGCRVLETVIHIFVTGKGSDILGLARIKIHVEVSILARFWFGIAVNSH